MGEQIELHIVRDDQNEHRTLGTMIGQGWTLDTLELPWKNNQHDISCIPTGRYALAFTWSQHHGKSMWHICGVPGREAIEIHVGNTVKDSLGCVLVGLERQQDSILESISAYAQFLTHMKPYQDHGGWITIS
jgi:hypothetical protein